jgi:DNA invertase Pin-like site-specific DNA recombinase
MTTAVYVRVSSKLQESANGTDSQEHAIVAWLTRNGMMNPVPTESSWVERVALTTAKSDVQWYRESGARSGRSTKNRTAYAELLAGIETGEITQVVAFSLSRLSRSVVDAAAYIKLSIGKGVKTTFVSDNFVIDPTNPMSKAFAQIASVFAELQADIIRENVKSGVRAKIAGGAKWGGARTLDRSRKGCSHLTDDDKKAIKNKPANVSNAELAKKLGVSLRVVEKWRSKLCPTRGRCVKAA